MKEYTWNNNWHNLVQTKECLKCNNSIMKLEAKEKHGVVSYFYVCQFVARFSSCGNIEEVK